MLVQHQQPAEPERTSAGFQCAAIRRLGIEHRGYTN
jgi:hypothetical protein